jgi:F-type H+-transporting ATPase subunit b
MLSAATSVVLAQAEGEAGHAAADEGGNFLVTPELGLMLWTLIAFGVTLWFLSKFAFPRIQEALDRRQRAIEESIDAAERTRQEADQILAEYRERLAEARSQADEIVARARKTGEASEAESLAEARRKREEMLEQTRREIQAETRRAIQEIRKEVADLTVLATEKVTRKTLDEADQKRLVDEALSELDFAALAGDERGSRE